MDLVTLTIPSSSANVGLGYDVWCLGLEEPRLRVTASRRPQGVLMEARSPLSPPQGRALGYAGKVAAEALLKERGVKEGLDLYYEDEGYPVGGLGRSGAEAVGAVLAAALLYGQPLTRDEAIAAAARGEPGEHMDNVAGSLNGRFSIIARSPGTGALTVDVYDPPPDLGIAIVYSSHQKTSGTAGMRTAVEGPVAPADFVTQMGLVSAATAALVSGNTSRFLELSWGDRFHEPRRAHVGGYGGFSAADLAAIKQRLFQEHRVALNISGAGPNLQVLYSTWEHPEGIAGEIGPLLAEWGARYGLRLEMRRSAIAAEGAYAAAVKDYGL